jgi:isopenicillin-N epimerase
MTPHASGWLLDPSTIFLNHGSFGSCPQPVMDAQAALRLRIERDPVHFFNEELDGGLEAARQAVAALVGADGDDLVFVRNATSGVAAVLASLRLQPGDELLRTDHGYNACNNILDRAAEGSGARVVVAKLPFPLRSSGEVETALLAALSPRTRLVLIDHITSPTGLVLPIESLVPALQARGVEVLVDGAHGPGMVPLDLNRLGAAYYTGNLHKWCCAARGAAFLHVRRDRQAGLHPAVTSHGKNIPRTDRSRFLLEFDWQGSDDYTAMLTVPVALRYMAALRPGGLPQLMADNRVKALAARLLLARALGRSLPCPDEMIGALASLPLPNRSPRDPQPQRAVPPHIDPLQAVLYERHRIQVPVVPWPASPQRLIRVSAQDYNAEADYQTLARALRELLPPDGAA